MRLKKYLDGQGRGAAKHLAEQLAVSPSYLSQLSSGAAAISPARCVQIETATGGKVSRKDLRDDWKSIWPELAAS